jgi:hypothetical protein
MFESFKEPYAESNSPLRRRSFVLARLAVALALTTEACDCCAVGQADDARRLRTIGSDYAKGLAELRARFATVNGLGAYTDSRRRGVAIRSYDVEFSRKPGSYKYVIRNHAFLENGKPIPITDSAVCSSPDLSFSLHKTEGGSVFLVSRVAKEPFIDSPSAPLPKFLDTTFSLGAYPLPELLADANFELSKAEELTDGSKRNLKISFRRTVRPDPAKARSQVLSDGWVIVSPQERWATQRYEYRQVNAARGSEGGPGAVVTSGLVEYGESTLGIPVPRRAEMKTLIRLAGMQRKARLGEGLHDGDELQVEVFEFKQIQMQPDADDAFTGRAFGLPDPPRGQEERK